MNCGRRYGLVGLNGSGKSTILACIGNREVSLTGVQQRHRGTSLRRLKIPFICDLVNVLTRQYTRVYHSIETAARMFTDPSVDASILDTLIKMTLEVELAKNEDWQLGVVRVKSVESMLIEGLFVWEKQTSFTWETCHSTDWRNSPEELITDHEREKKTIVCLRFPYLNTSISSTYRVKWLPWRKRRWNAWWKWIMNVSNSKPKRNVLLRSPTMTVSVRERDRQVQSWCFLFLWKKRTINNKQHRAIYVSRQEKGNRI